MYRADPHLSDEQWRAVFQRMAKDRVANILFIASHLVSLPYLAFMSLQRCKGTPCGREANVYRIRQNQRFVPLSLARRLEVAVR